VSNQDDELFQYTLLALREAALVWVSGRSRGLDKENSDALPDDDSDPPIPKPELQSIEIRLQIKKESNGLSDVAVRTVWPA
jgi:hypothetical protein